MGGRQQSRRRRPAGQCRTAVPCPLLPAFRGMGVEQFIGERPDDVVVQRLGARGKILVPPPARRIERITRRLRHRSEEHTSALQSLMRNSYAVFCLKKKTNASHSTFAY